jgi:hypothetical protein
MHAVGIERDARAQVSELLASVLRFTRARPYSALGLGVAAGYLLGGGLFTPLTGRLVRSSGAFASFPEVQEGFLAALEQAVLSAVLQHTPHKEQS